MMKYIFYLVVVLCMVELRIYAANFTGEVFEKLDKIKTSLSDVRTVTVTAYTPTSAQCDTDPLITASMEPARPGTVAVSRDLFKDGWVFGKKIYIEGHGIFEIIDLMAPRWSSRIDIVLFKKKDAESFGVKTNKIAALIRM